MVEMLAGIAYTERLNQVAGIVYRSTADMYGLEGPKSWQEAPQKVAKNNRAVLLWDFKFQTDKQRQTNHSGG